MRAGRKPPRLLEEILGRDLLRASCWLLDVADRLATLSHVFELNERPADGDSQAQVRNRLHVVWLAASTPWEGLGPFETPAAASIPARGLSDRERDADRCDGQSPCRLCRLAIVAAQSEAGRAHPGSSLEPGKPLAT